MLRPTKHMNLDISVLRISSCVIDILKKHKMIRHDELLEEVIQSIGSDARIIFVPSISFLYIIGLIDYDLKTDSFVYTKEDNNEIK